MRKIIIAISIFMYIVMSGTGVCTIQAEEHATGALEMTEEEWEEFIENTPEIVDVKLNEKGLELVNEALGEQEGLLEEVTPVEMGEEIVTDEDAAEAVLSVNEEAVLQSEEILPVSVDVSASNTFPPIGDQGQSNSCTAWANAYYMMTNNLANVRGWDAKHNSDYWISPKWVYNLLTERVYDDFYQKNRGDGIYIDSALQFLCEQGAPFYYELQNPDTGMDNWRNWETNTSLWEKAIDNKMESFSNLKIYDTKNQKLILDKLKKVLLNGYVVTFASHINEFDYVSLAKDSGLAKAGEEICYIVRNGKAEKPGYHAMTIVGYDDSIEIDWNVDGKVDTYGALKIANSYGSTWRKNNGYIWLAYDALLPESEVESLKGEKRRLGIDRNTVYVVESKKSYTPLMLAEITMSTQSRQQIRLDFGISKNNSEEMKSKRTVNGDWDELYKTYSFFYSAEKSDMYNFSGGKTLEEATFVFDLTPLVKKFWQYSSRNVTNQASNHFYIQLTDSVADSYATHLVRIKLIDKIGNMEKEVICNQKTANGNSVTELIDFQVLPMLVDSQKSFTASYKYPMQQKLVDENHIYITNQDGELQENLLELSEDRKALTIDAPDMGYAKDSYYILTHKQVLTDGGNTAKKGDKFYFYVP